MPKPGEPGRPLLPTETFFSWTSHGEQILKQIMREVCQRYGGQGQLIVEQYRMGSVECIKVTAYYQCCVMLRHTNALAAEWPLQRILSYAYEAMVRSVMELGYVGNVPGRANTPESLTIKPGYTRLSEWTTDGQAIQEQTISETTPGNYPATIGAGPANQ